MIELKHEEYVHVFEQTGTTGHYRYSKDLQHHTEIIQMPIPQEVIHILRHEYGIKSFSNINYVPQ